MENLLESHLFVLNSSDPSAEHITIKTLLFDNGDRKLGLKSGVFLNQVIELQSYGNAAQITLGTAALTPTSLRVLANQLEEIIKKHQT